MVGEPLCDVGSSMEKEWLVANVKADRSPNREEHAILKVILAEGVLVNSGRI